MAKKRREISSLDVFCKPDDIVSIEVQERPTGRVLYVNINGQTRFRVDRISNPIELESGI